LVPLVLSGAASLALPAGKACWPGHNGTVIIKLNSYPQHVSILRLGYLTESRGQRLLKFGGTDPSLPLLQGPEGGLFSRGLKAAFLPVHGSGTAVEIDTLPESCRASVM
jgi:hypothetical protein